MNAVIFGAPGSGKGTYSTRLQDKLGVDVISMGDIFRTMLKENTILGRIIKRYVEAGLLVPDPIVVEVLADIIAHNPKGKGFILDGFPRTLAQAEALENIAKIDVIIELAVPDWIIIERLSSRRICKSCGAAYNLRFMKPQVEGICDRCGGSLFQRSDDNPTVIKMRLEVYQNETSPLICFYDTKSVPIIKHTTDALAMPPEKVVDHIVKELTRLTLI
ncbi:MAG: nucleoside monophosphate kinase [Candidatus Bathyarchaeota archaeon]|nr:nucleoside monophosphate kinase [Candidatus Bathyarchaeota archaeon]